MKKFEIIVCALLSLPKTIYFNFRVFNFKTAIKLPIFIEKSVRLRSIYKYSVEIKTDKLRPFMIKIGIGGSEAINSSNGILYLNKHKKGKIIFTGDAKFGKGIVIYNNSGTITFGSNFSCNKNCFFSSDKSIIFGNDVLIGWNVKIRDSDGHLIIYDKCNSSIEDRKSVKIGNHVWICSYVDILKGCVIDDDCVIAYRSLLTGINAKQNSLIGGLPAKIIKENISWKK